MSEQIAIMGDSDKGCAVSPIEHGRGGPGLGNRRWWRISGAVTRQLLRDRYVAFGESSASYKKDPSPLVRNEVSLDVLTRKLEIFDPYTSAVLCAFYA